MGYHPLNLGLRFLLEIGGFAAFVIWGHGLVEGTWGWVLGIGVGILAFAVWGVFNVPGDESRSGEAPVPVPGWVRLALELAYFGLAVWGLAAVGRDTWALGFGVLVGIHYLISWDRIGWLLSQR